MNKYCDSCKAIVTLTEGGYCPGCGVHADNMTNYNISIDCPMVFEYNVKTPKTSFINKGYLLEKARQIALEQKTYIEENRPEDEVAKGVLIGMERIIGLIERI